MKDSVNMRSARALSIIIDNLSLPNKQLHEICSQMNEGHQNLLNCITQYALHCKLAEKNNELPPKRFQIFLNGDAVFEKKLFNQGNN